MKLKISDSLSLPIEAVTQTFAIVARKRVGKTYTASVMAEEFISAKLPIVVLDPTGAWWGLRSTADGKGDGYPVVIIGGSHGDVPLEEHAGKVIADLVVDHPGFYVIDFSLTESEAAQDRFATDFGTHFYRRKESARFPMHLFIDEADAFMPQQPFPGQKKMLGAFDTIIRRGGIRGIGATLITQRPAVLNKNALTQAETLIALQMSGSQDIDAIEHWTRVHGTKEQRAEMIGSIATLQRGECWFWSPSWLEVFKRINIRERQTFNSSATPKAGEKAIIAPKLAPVDIQKLGDRIKDAAEKVKENDPAELRRRIIALQKELGVLKTQSQKIPSPVQKEISVLTDEDRRLVSNLAEKMEEFSCRREELIKSQVVLSKAIVTVLEQSQHIKQKLLSPPSRVAPQPMSARVANPVIPRTVTPDSTNGDISIGKCERALLSVLAKYPEGCTKNKLILLAGYSWSGSTQNALGKLRALGLVDGQNSGVIKITDAGMANGKFDPLPEGEQFLDYWLNYPQFGKCERTLLKCLIENPAGLDRQQLLEASGYEWSGSTQNALGALRTAGVIVGRNIETMRAVEEFFQ